MEKVTANELESFRPYHPGELLKLAKQLGFFYAHRIYNSDFIFL